MSTTTVATPNSPIEIPSETPSQATSVRQEIALAVCVAVPFGLLCGWKAFLHTPVYFAVNLLGSVAWLAAGIVLKFDKTKRKVGWLLTASGLLWSTQVLGTWNMGPLPVTGMFSNSVFYVVAALAILGYPMSQQAGRATRLFVIVALPILVLDRVPMLITSRPEWFGFSASTWWPSFLADRKLYDVVSTTVASVEFCIAVIFVWVVWLRLRDMSGIDYLVTVPIFIGSAVVGILSAVLSTAQMFPVETITTNYFLVSLVILSLPIGFLVTTLRRRLQHAAIADSLHRSLTGHAPTVENVCEALRIALRDPALDILYWTNEQSNYVDTNGTPVDRAQASSTRVTREVKDRAGNPLALVVVDRSLGRHPEVLDTALSASSMALEIASLQAAVRSQLEEVRRSRSRIVEAGLEERRRIERDLHDGVQQRLLAVVAQLGRAKHGSSDDRTTEAIAVATDDLRSTLNELRDLARGIHPTELRQFGLRAAVEVIAEKLSLDIEMDVVDGRFNVTAEATAYFVICEGLANVVKHARARRVTVRVSDNDEALTVEVIDDGTGAASMRSGTGLTGLSDRVHATGGTFNIAGIPGKGTTLTAVIPR